MSESLAGKVALVTGAARRIGAAIAWRLHDAGASVVLHHRGGAADARQSVREMNAARAGSALQVEADLLEEGAPEKLVAAALAGFDRLDILVNNASAFYATPFGRVELRHWNDLLGSNLRAPLFLAQAAASALAQAQGSIVNIVDIHAERPLKNFLVYSIAKAGLGALTRGLALELAPGVRVNGVAPGAIAWPEDEGKFDHAERRRVLATTPLARIGAPADIAQAVHFLCTAPFITGEIVVVDGGRSVVL